jgi:hypothetical protein
MRDRYVYRWGFVWRVKKPESETFDGYYSAEMVRHWSSCLFHQTQTAPVHVFPGKVFLSDDAMGTGAIS